MKVAVLGNGGFGTSMAIVTEVAGHTVAVWGHDADYTQQIATTRQNERYLPSITIPESIVFTADARRALHGAEFVLVAVPTQHMRAVVRDLAEHVPAEVPLISLAKGLEQSTADRPSQILRQEMPAGHPVLVLSGPSHAEEVAALKPTTVVLAGDDEAVVADLQEAMSSPTFRVYSNPDRLGVELCGALKNVMAVAAGIGEGLGLGDNAKASVLSRGIVEMARFGVAEGADLQTFFGLAGMGDLAVTAFSPHGRNRAFGERIGRGETLEQILASTHKVAEGVWTSRVVRKRAGELGVDMPLSCAVCDVLFEGVPARDAVAGLMERDHKDEVLR